MKQLEVFNKIGGIIKELNDQYKYIEANPSELNELELELFIANAHFLADHAEILGKLSKIKTVNPAEAVKPAEAIKPAEAVNPAEAKNEVAAEKYFEPVVRHPDSSETRAGIDLSSDTPQDSYSYVREEPEMIRHELVVDETDWDEESEEEEEAKSGEKVDEPVVELSVAPLKEAVKPPVTPEPAIKDEVYTINQKISDQLGAKNGITEQAGTQPVTDLKQAITLNDKLLYVKDLFNGYSLAYSEAIEILNRFNTYDEAERFLNKNYVAKNNWEAKPETTKKFYNLLRRRYA